MNNRKMTLRLYISMLLLILNLVLVQTTVFASEVPIPHQNGDVNGLVEPKEMNKFLTSVTGDVNGFAPLATILLSALFSIMFLFGIIKMIYALITKTGMVLKGSTGVLIGIPVFFLMLRLFFILSFTVDSSSATLLITDFLNLLVNVGYLSAVGMVLVGLSMKLFHRFLEHPEYGRWSKRLYIGAASLTLLTAIMPNVFKSI